MTDSQIDTNLLQQLIEAYHDADPDLSEANVAEAFVARFFIVAPAEVENRFKSEVRKDPFHRIKSRYTFKS